MNRQHILAEIRRLASESNGTPPGYKRFQSETRIRPHEWGRYWARWGDALREAGFAPNEWVQQFPESELLERLSALVREIGHFPVTREIQLRGHRDASFPSPRAFRRFGGQEALAVRLREYCLERGRADVAALCDVVPRPRPATAVAVSEREVVLGFVYLIKSGRFYKIGRSNAVGRREYELDIALPEAVKVVHKIKTDDPPGIEEYWHRRFADRRKKGEWFELSAEDVAAFRRRKFM